MTPQITVVIPTYNRAGLIGETLLSVMGQSYAPAEVVVVDDGSLDDTEAVVRRFGPAVRYVRIDNSGECRARNVGVSVTSAPWIAFCDSDDLWAPDKLSRQAQLFERAPDVEYSFTNFSTVVNGEWSERTKFDDAPPGYWSLPRRETGPDAFVVEAPMFERLLQHQPIFPSTLMMKRSFFEAAGGWREPLGRTPSVDLEFHLRCVNQPRIGVVSAPVVGIRKHASNFSGNTLLTTMGEIEILRYVLANHPAARQHAPALEEQIVLRSAMAAEGSFAAGEMAAVRELLRVVPFGRRSWKLHLKSLIAACPRRFGQTLQKALAAGSSAASKHYAT